MIFWKIDDDRMNERDRVNDRMNQTSEASLIHERANEVSQVNEAANEGAKRLSDSNASEWEGEWLAEHGSTEHERPKGVSAKEVAQRVRRKHE